MANETTRRGMLKKTGWAAAGLGVLGVPEWALPVLAQGETLVSGAGSRVTAYVIPTNEELQIARECLAALAGAAPVS